MSLYSTLEQVAKVLCIHVELFSSLRHQLTFRSGIICKLSMLYINSIEINRCGQSCFGRSENLKGIRGFLCGMVRSKLTDCEYNIANEESCSEEVGVICSK